MPAADFEEVDVGFVARPQQESHVVPDLASALGNGPQVLGSILQQRECFLQRAECLDQLQPALTGSIGEHLARHTQSLVEQRGAGLGRLTHARPPRLQIEEETARGDRQAFDGARHGLCLLHRHEQR